MTNVFMHAHVGLQGRFKFIKRRASDLEIIEEVGEFPNVITFSGQDYLGGAYSPWTAFACRVGTGNTTPTQSDTALVNQVSGTITLQAGFTYVNNTTNRYTDCSATWRFPAGSFSGQNLAEVAIGIGTTNSPGTGNSAANPTQPIFNRALIVDGSGNPTTITILSDEVLDVVFTLRLQAPASDLTGTFTVTVNGTPVNYNYTARPMQSSSANTTGWLWDRTTVVVAVGNNGTGGGSSWGAGNSGASTSTSLSPVFGSPGTSGVYVNSYTSAVSMAAYTAGSYYRDATFTWGLNNGNNVNNILYGFGFTLAAFQVLLSSTLGKLNTQTLNITCRLSWANLP